MRKNTWIIEYDHLVFGPRIDCYNFIPWIIEHDAGNNLCCDWLNSVHRIYIIGRTVVPKSVIG